MSKLLSVFIFAALLVYSSDLKYNVVKGDALAADTPASLREALPSPGIKILTASGEPYLEFWFVEKALPTAKLEDAATVDVQHGALVGMVRVGKGVNDRRGDRMPPGLYVLRLSFHPVDGAHQGVATQRDFLILTPTSDSDTAAIPNFADLMKAAKQASGSNHPLSLSCWKQDGDFSPGLHPVGEHDTALHVKVGGVPLAIIIAGKYEG